MALRGVSSGRRRSRQALGGRGSQVPSTPLSTFYGEVARLRTLYAAVRHSFRETAATTSAAVEARRIKKYTPFTINPESATASAVLPSVQIFLSRLQQQFPRYLRETLFVRVISALEVFLIEAVREVFVARRDLFHTEQRIEFSVGELLSADSVVDLWQRMIAASCESCRTRASATWSDTIELALA